VTTAESSIDEQQSLPEGELLRVDRRSRWSERACGAWFLLFAGFGAAIAAVEGTVYSVVITLVFGAIGFTNLGLPGAGLIVLRHGIVIRELQWGGWIRIREWTWSEVDHFEVGRPLVKWALRVHLTDGNVVSAPLLERKSVRKGPLAKAWVAELNRRAAAAND
jgi:hypothetical protein